MEDQMSEVDQLIYKQKNLGKNCKREIKIVFFLVMMGVFVFFELTINGRCLLTGEKWIFFTIDCIMYIGVFVISFIEIIIQNKKRKKKYKKQNRLRVLFCKSLNTYLCFVSTTLLLCLIHLGVQIYFFSFEFFQDCFYYNGQFKDTADFKKFKILLFVLFILIEVITIFFLIWVVKENYKAIKNPWKFRRSRVEISFKNDIVLQINSLTTC
ncbi:unnamed protein product [Paramecium octaurelia]|uniref:Transmembrane protein n=1 Tax=Paramecium octaurelia TaxID=43137 RepID=A0A8S1X1M5_PAROT|nr:unnamed protein product [Paramecium octaurelia]